jgi:hypothetical protein
MRGRLDAYDYFTINVSYGGYSVAGFPEDRLVPEELPSPPLTSQPLTGAVEPVDGGAFVFALKQKFLDERVLLAFVKESLDVDPLPEGTVTRRFSFTASTPVVVNTIDWDYVTALPAPIGAPLDFEIVMMPRGPDGTSSETHYLRLLTAAEDLS